MATQNEPQGNLRIHKTKTKRIKTKVQKLVEEAEEQVRAAATGDEQQTYLAPPLPFRVCYWLHENSSALRPCIDVYKTNIDGFGHEFPEKYTEDEVKAAIQIDLERGESGSKAKPMKAWKTEVVKAMDGATDWPATVNARYEELRKDIEQEHDELKHFFEYATPGQSFIETRMNTREDREITGNGFWEVVRGEKSGQPLKIYPATAKYITLCRAGDPVPVPMKEQVNAMDFRIVYVMRRLRVYKQQMEEGGRVTYFKEFGDPRVVSADTGNTYKTNAEMQSKEGHGVRKVPEATELIHFRIHSGSSPYGIPRWLGAYKLIQGLIEKDDVDLQYYVDNTVPPGFFAVSGHTQKLGKDMIDSLSGTLRDAKERGKAHVETPVIEATTDAMSNLTAKIEYINLMDARLKEATHIKYAEMCKEYIRQMFRLPKFLLGDAKDVNRSTSVSILEMAEMQVFAAERKAFDFYINHVFFPELDVRYHKFKSLTPQMEDLEAMAASLEKLIKSWLLKPNEGRKHIKNNTTLDLDETDEAWGKRPPEATMSGRGYEPEGGEAAGAAEKVMADFEGEQDFEVQRATAWMHKRDKHTGKTAIEALADSVSAHQERVAHEKVMAEYKEKFKDKP